MCISLIAAKRRTTSLDKLGSDSSEETSDSIWLSPKDVESELLLPVIQPDKRDSSKEIIRTKNIKDLFITIKSFLMLNIIKVYLKKMFYTRVQPKFTSLVETIGSVNI